MSVSEKSVYVLTNEGKLDLSAYNEKRKQKYKLKNVLKTLDLDKQGIVTVDLLLTVAADNGIQFSERDQTYLRQQQANYQGKLHYENIIKDLILLVAPSSQQPAQPENDQQLQFSAGTFPNRHQLLYEWVLRSNNQALVSNIKNNGAINYNSLIKVKLKHTQNQFHKTNNSFSKFEKASVGNKGLRSGANSPRAEGQLLDEGAGASGGQTLKFEKPAVPETGRFSNMSQYGKEVQGQIQAMSSELQSVVHKIIGNKVVKTKTTAIDWSKHLSAGSKKINLRKNIQNRLFIKSVTSSEKVLQSKERIRKYMKDNEVDIMHLNAINSVFLDCDEEGMGHITKKQFLMQISDENLQFPADFLFNLITDLQVDSQDMSEDAVLKYENLKNIMEIYNNCPIFLKGDSNNSDNFKGNMDLNRDMDSSYERLDKILKHIHARIEEKFKDFRHAFRSMDKDFGGSLDFKEFITGMEEIGIKLKLSDYRLVFDAIDYDQKGSIGFYKFCLLNTDRKKDLLYLKQQFSQSQEQQQQQQIVSGKSKGSKKPPLPPLSITGQSQDSKNLSGVHPLFGDNIPKNKDINMFARDVQQVTPVQTYMAKRMLKSAHKEGFKTVVDLPEAHTFGKAQVRDHDIVALLTNSYSEDLKRISIEELRNSLASRKTLLSKPTQAQMMRDKATKIKFSPIPRRNSTSMQNTPTSQKKQGSRNAMFLLKGSNSFNKSCRVSQSPHNSRQQQLSKSGVNLDLPKFDE